MYLINILIFQQDPSKSQFLDDLKSFHSMCSPDCEVLVYLATHAGRINRGWSSKGNYIFFKDSQFGSKSEIVETSVSAKDLASLLKEIPGKHRHIALDVCHVKKPRSSVIMIFPLNFLFVCSNFIM